MIKTIYDSFAYRQTCFHGPQSINYQNYLTLKISLKLCTKQDYLHQSDSQLTALQQQLQKIKDQEKK